MEQVCSNTDQAEGFFRPISVPLHEYGVIPPKLPQVRSDPPGRGGPQQLCSRGPVHKPETNRTCP